VASFIAADGVRLHYELEGEGPPLLLHLGAGCDATLWQAAGYLPTLSESHGCILFDHRGHGESDHPLGAAVHDVDCYADDVIGLIGHLGHESVSFFGWSNAVVVGLKAAERRPELFDSLIFFGPIAAPTPPDQLEAAVAKRVEALRQKGWWYLLDEMIPAEKDPVPQWMIDRIVATDIEPYIAWSEARLSWDWCPWRALGHVDVPTLWIVGELEDPDDAMAQAASLMPNSTRIRVPDKEHINAFLDSEFVLPSITTFLREPPRRPSEA
jgi:pimeloyl-ACP methyl ester carboxylesterase